MGRYMKFVLLSAFQDDAYDECVGTESFILGWKT